MFWERFKTSSAQQFRAFQDVKFLVFQDVLKAPVKRFGGRQIVRTYKNFFLVAIKEIVIIILKTNNKLESWVATKLFYYSFMLRLIKVDFLNFTSSYANIFSNVMWIYKEPLALEWCRTQPKSKEIAKRLFAFVTMKLKNMPFFKTPSRDCAGQDQTILF